LAVFILFGKKAPSISNKRPLYKGIGRIVCKEGVNG
jgi:hypothetical protein